MKATINGVLLEGTPEEIVMYQKLNETENKKKVVILCNTHEKNAESLFREIEYGLRERGVTI